MSDLTDLYRSMEDDLHLHAWPGEDERSFHSRLVYSGLCNWILSASTDCDSENGGEPSDRVLKSHVTVVARDVLLSFIKADPSLALYFPQNDILDLINEIEKNYVYLGYFDSDDRTFVKAKKKGLIQAVSTNAVLHIDYPCRFHTMMGMGLLRTLQNGDKLIPLNDYLGVFCPAKESFITLANSLKFEPFAPDSLRGMVECYDPLQKKWSPFDQAIVEGFDFVILRFDRMAYSMTKKIGSRIQIASLPSLYYATTNDPYHQHEIWRIIMGCCAYLGHPFEARFSTDDRKDFSRISLGGFLLPGKENAFLHCFCWPEKNCRNVFGFETRSIYVPTMKFLFSLFDIAVVEA